MSTMVEILRRIVDTKGAGCSWGLCRELNTAEDYDPDVLESLFEAWEHFSGCPVFPVPDPDYPGDRIEAARIFTRLERGETFLGEYGELRLELAQHLLEALEERFGV